MCNCNSGYAAGVPLKGEGGTGGVRNGPSAGGSSWAGSGPERGGDGGKVDLTLNAIYTFKQEAALRAMQGLIQAGWQDRAAIAIAAWDIAESMEMRNK